MADQERDEQAAARRRVASATKVDVTLSEPLLPDGMVINFTCFGDELSARSQAIIEEADSIHRPNPGRVGY